jgi:hypothetical protein
MPTLSFIAFPDQFVDVKKDSLSLSLLAYSIQSPLTHQVGNQHPPLPSHSLTAQLTHSHTRNFYIRLSCISTPYAILSPVQVFPSTPDMSSPKIIAKKKKGVRKKIERQISQPDAEPKPTT